MNSDVEAELRAVASALRAHLQWSETLGTSATPRVDEEWLQRRRAQYRALPVEAEEALPVAPGATSSPEPSGTAASLDVPEPVAVVADVSAPAQATEPTAVPPQAFTPPQFSPPPRLEPAAPPRALAPPEQAPPGKPTDRSPPAPISPARASAPAPAPPPAARPILLGSEALTRLTLLEQEVKACTRCPLHQTRTQTVFARGEGSSGVCFVGEGPGADEDLQGVPFVGAAGQLLDRMIAAMGLQRDEVYVCNIVKCRPPGNRKPMPDEADACQGYLEEQIELVAPRVIVALGATAASGLLGMPVSITRLRGNWRLYRGKIPLMPTFHPSYLLRQPAAKREVWNDLLLVLDQVGLPRPAQRK